MSGMCWVVKTGENIYISPVLFNINSVKFGKFLTVVENQLNYIMGSKKLCIIYFNCPHCYSSGVDSSDSCDTNSDMEDLIEVAVAELSKNIKDVGGVVLMDEEIGDEAGVEVEPEVENVVQQGGYDAELEDN